MRKVTHIFEVHLNESACRKGGRLGLEQVLNQPFVSRTTIRKGGNDKLPQGVVGYIFLYMCKSRGTFENTVQTLSYIDVQSNCAKPGEEKSMELHNCIY